MSVDAGGPADEINKALEEAMAEPGPRLIEVQM